MESDGQKLKCIQVFEGREEKRFRRSKGEYSLSTGNVEEKQQSPNERASGESQVSVREQKGKLSGRRLKSRRIFTCKER